MDKPLDEGNGDVEEGEEGGRGDGDGGIKEAIDEMDMLNEEIYCVSISDISNEETIPKSVITCEDEVESILSDKARDDDGADDDDELEGDVNRVSNSCMASLRAMNIEIGIIGEILICCATERRDKVEGMSVDNVVVLEADEEDIVDVEKVEEAGGVREAVDDDDDDDREEVGSWRRILQTLGF